MGCAPDFRLTECGLYPNNAFMKEVHELLARVDAYKKRAGCKDSTASLRIFNDGKRLKSLRKTKRMWPETVVAALKRIDELEAVLDQEAA